MGATYRIELLGGLRCIFAGNLVSRFSTQKTGVLLAYLALNLGRSHPRDVLVNLLWPDSEPQAGRGSLSVALSALRHQLEPPGVPAGALLVANRSSVGLRAGAVATDVGEFEALQQAAGQASSGTERRQLLTRAVGLYAGELLPGYYEDWILVERERLMEAYLSALRELVVELEAAGAAREALEFAHRQVKTDPLREEAHQDLIRLYAATGQHTAALRQFETLKTLLHQELGAQPSGATEALAADIARRAARAKAPREPVSPRHPPPADGLPTGTVTFLLTDVDGLKAADSDAEGALPAAQREQHTLLRRLLHQHGGQVVSESPGGFVAAFSRATDALECAVDAQRVLTAHHWSGKGKAPRIRMALGTEEVSGSPGDAALRLRRVPALLMAAHGGQILCAAETYTLLRRDLPPGVRLAHLGVYRLEGTEGPERLFQVVHPGMVQRHFPPPRARRGLRGSLPMQLTRFFGREAELAGLGAMVLDEGNRLVTLTGPGGCGKTRLALELASRMTEPFHGAVWFASAADLTEGTHLPERLAEALGLPPSAETEPLEQVIEVLSRQPSLLVIDNLEQVVGSVGLTLKGLLERVPGLTCLCTSRQRLGLSGEREFVVQPLPVPPGALPPAELARCDSVQLFVDRAQAVRPDFQITEATAPAIAELCRRLEGFPLALELAAARAQVLTPAQMLAHLERRFDFLVSRQRDVSMRHRTLKAAVDWSYQLLRPELQRFLARLSVFRGGWTLEAAERVCDEPHALDYLTELRECSLVLAEEAEGTPMVRSGQAGPHRRWLGLEEASGVQLRYRLLETLREYAAARLEEAGETQRLRRQHLLYYQSVMELAQWGPLGRRPDLWLRWFDREHGNLLAALEWAAESDRQVYLRLVGTMGEYWHVSGLWSEGRVWLERALEPAAVRGGESGAPPSSEEALWRVPALWRLADLALHQGDYEVADRRLQEALELCRQAADGPLGGPWREFLGEQQAACLSDLADIAAHRGEYDAARGLYAESLALRREVGEQWGVAQVLRKLGDLALAQGDYSTAQDCYGKSLEQFRILEAARGVAKCLGRLGVLASRRGDLEAADAHLAEGLSIYREIGDRFGLGSTVRDSGDLAYLRGEYPEALERYREALGVWSDIGNRRDVAGVLERMARAAARLSQAAWAARLLGAAAALRAALNAPLEPQERGPHEECLSAVRRALGDSFAEAWSRGSRMAWHEAAVPDSAAAPEEPAPVRDDRPSTPAA